MGSSDDEKSEVKAAREVLSELLIDKYRVGKLLGRGSYGNVFSVSELAGSEEYAAKMIELDNVENPSSLEREASVLDMSQGHPHIVGFKEKFRNSSTLCIVMELMDRNFADVIFGSPLSAGETKPLLHQILLAIEHCHKIHIIHRDLKPSNLLMSGDTIKLADFGSAKFVGSESEGSLGIHLTQYVGTRAYAAPEMLLGANEYTSAIDIWSVGCILAQMLKGGTLFDVEADDVKDIGCYPFDGDSDDRHAYDRKLDAKQLTNIFSVLGTPDDVVLTGISAFSQRYSIPFFPPKGLKAVFPQLDPSCLDLLTMLLFLDPSKRITASAALNHPFFKD